ncbi:hypothetical protein GE21DRAFT_4955 [Neurospora crassa]|uniref:Uncharacterized protein n=1 Tax=Neurospora crassa (strain ATCC 24698 / 74-OR23-1A / CBS 708.71 / DSM 1257 / FGSC 987) TaxID=367110 RepID=Q7S321_NEUCR|nr:hypothetical protein NCU07526 [Neurospora crassa OR74A]EAA29803.1 hypothetical protein NCU07526 [Neurospora crassa OR74A]KHE80140.1 hypothetical protein GE21DRAFT_4955 [Neurospora crassa]|eukprot:XP_959039.1 hypothetical protein NCU07526 [Neurospora crassa OR74A]
MPHLSSHGLDLLHHVLDNAEPAAARYPRSPTSPSQREPLTSSWDIPIIVTGRGLQLVWRMRHCIVSSTGYIGNWRIVFACIYRQKERITNATPWKYGAFVRSSLALGLIKQREGILAILLELCHSRGSLEHPVGLSNEDVRDDLIDETSLRKSLRGRPFNPDKVPTQINEEQEIRPKQAAYDTIGITDFENTKNMPPRRATARTGKLPTRRDGSFCSSDDLTCARPCSETTNPENYIGPLTSAVHLVDIASFAFKQAWNTSNDNDYEHQPDRCTYLIHPHGLRVRRLKEEPNCLDMKPA